MVFDAYVSMYREVPGFTQIRFGDVVDLRLMDDQRDNNTVIADRLAGLLAERFTLPLDRPAAADLGVGRDRRRHPQPGLPAQAVPRGRGDRRGTRVVRAYLSGHLD